jgi:hypothetical protein
MWMRHQRLRDMMRMFETYAAQGKEPPPAMVEALSRGNRHGDWNDRYSRRYDRDDWAGDWWSYRYSRFGIMRRAVVLLSLSAAFFMIDYMQVFGDRINERAGHVFLIPAIILGALGAGSLLMLMFHDKHPDDRNRP